MSSRALMDLHPFLQPLAGRLTRLCLDRGINTVVTCTWRSPQEQDDLQGRTKPGNIVTHARGGQSDHNFMLDGKPASKAFDIYPLCNGKIVTDGDDDLWQKVADIALNHNGIEYCDIKNGIKYTLGWLGNGRTIKDMPHFYLVETKL
jgi:peptidoglycan L-alanyl-D-glutamate endopeptidase CwlK